MKHGVLRWFLTKKVGTLFRIFKTADCNKEILDISKILWIFWHYSMWNLALDIGEIPKVFLHPSLSFSFDTFTFVSSVPTRHVTGIKFRIFTNIYEDDTTLNILWKRLGHIIFCIPLLWLCFKDVPPALFIYLNALMRFRGGSLGIGERYCVAGSGQGVVWSQRPCRSQRRSQSPISCPHQT